MRVCIVGAGAIGGLLAESFVLGGAEVGLVARGAHLAALRDHGLNVRFGEQTAHYACPAGENPAFFGQPDVVVLALKAYSIAAMLPRIAPLLRLDTVVIPAINGLPWWYFARHPSLPAQCAGWRIECLDPNGAMTAALDPRHLLGCVVHAAGEVVAPGVVARTTGVNVYMLGELDGSMSPRLSAITETLQRGGATVKATAQIRNEIWTKLVGNMSYNPVAALTLARMNEINASEGLLRCIRIQMQEAMQVAAYCGETVTMSIDDRIALARTIGASKISMHQDLERGRPLEVDAVVTAVLELAAKAGIATPMIDAVHALITERARHAGVT